MTSTKKSFTMTSMAKNFAGQNLRGQSFKGQDLSGADFSGTDLKDADFSDTNLRGTDFTEAILEQATFLEAKTGVQKRWLGFQLTLSIIVNFIAGIYAVIVGSLLGSWLFYSNDIPLRLLFLFMILFLIFWIVMLLKIVHHVFLATTLVDKPLSKYISKSVSISILGGVFIVAIIMVTTSVILTVGGFSNWLSILSLLINFALSISTILLIGTGIVIAIVIVIMSQILSVVVSGMWGGAIVGCLNMIWTVWMAMSIYTASTIPVSNKIATASSVALVAVVTLSIGIYVARCTLTGNFQFAPLLKFAVMFASIGGTSFRGADLTQANFSHTSLKSCDFRDSRKQNTNLKHTIWKQAKKLERACLGTSILANPEVRELLVTGKPNPSKSYEGLNLRGATLDGVYLEKVNFKRAILSEASFRNANLEWVNLTETQAIGTDFTGAQMTGVCLEGWSYDHTTKLADVDCRFVFELEHPNAKGSRERRPHDPDKEFAVGDFTKRYSETLNVVQLLIRNGINREAFIAAWQKLTEEYPDLNPDDIQEIKKKGQDVELTVAVSEETDKGKFEHNFDHSYETKLKEIEAKYQAQLESKEAMILLQKQSITDIKEILQIAKSSNINFSPTFQTEAKAVAEQNPVTITAGRDISGNVINLGEIKGNVTNAINQIPNKEDSGDIKTLLTQLQEAISADKELADEDKADALEQVENLAKIAIHDKPEEKSTLASKAIRALKRIIDNIPTITKIVETISKVFGA